MKKTLKLRESELIELIESTVKNNLPKVKPLSEDKVRRVKTRLKKWEKLNEGKSPEETLDSFWIECLKLKSHGYSPEIIGEAVKGRTILSEQDTGPTVVQTNKWHSGVWNTILEGFYGYLLNMFGVTGETKIMLRTVLSQVPPAHLPQLLMNCNVLVAAIVKALPEYLTGWIGRSTLFGGKDTNLGMLMSNVVADWMDSTEMYKGIDQKIRDLICNGHKVKVDKLTSMFNKKAEEEAAGGVVDVATGTEEAGGTDGILKSLLGKLF